MPLLELIVSSWSYLGIFALIFGINIVPVMMPPSWLVLASLFLLFPSLSPLYLAIIGATASTLGRFGLTYLGSAGRVFMGSGRKTSLDSLHGFLSKNRYSYFILSLAFAIIPVSSNMLFIAYGLMKARNFGMFLGFWIGRAVTYFVLIAAAPIFLKPVVDLFSNQLTGVIVVDAAGLLSIIAFALVDWRKLIMKRKLVFIKPSFMR